MSTYIKLQGEYIIAHQNKNYPGINPSDWDALVFEDNLVKRDSHNWYYKYKYVNKQLVELSKEELKNQPQFIEQLKSEARTKRNELLEKSDKYVINDYPISSIYKLLIKRYRRQLRDISKQKEFPLNVNYPEIPDNCGFIKNLWQLIKGMF